MDNQDCGQKEVKIDIDLCPVEIQFGCILPQVVSKIQTQFVRISPGFCATKKKSRPAPIIHRVRYVLVVFKIL